MPEEQGSCDRLAQRREVLLAARCRKSSWNVISVELGNISQGGCCIVGDAGEFSVGDSLELRIANLKSIAATVRWIRGANAGIEFRSALKARMIEEISRTYGIVISSAPAPEAPAAA